MKSSRVVVDEDDVPRVFLGARPTVELYAVFDHDWETPAWRLESLRQLLKVVKDDLVTLGYSDAYCFVADDVPSSYVKRLMRLGARKMMAVCLHFLEDEV
jgi:hypothetical protein